MAHEKAITYADLKAALNQFTPEQLAAEVLWWGEERGGKIVEVRILEEEYITLDDREGVEPRSNYEGETFDEDEIEARLPKGTPVLLSDL